MRYNIYTFMKVTIKESTKPSGVGIDVADWANDQIYFSRIFK